MDETIYSISETRRVNLRKIVEKYFNSVKECAEKIGIKSNNLSALLTGNREISNTMSLRIETALQLPEGSLTEMLQKDIDCLIDVSYYENISYVNDTSKESKIKISKKMADLMFNSGSDDIIILKMHDDLMSETIKKNELYLVDRNQTTITEGGIYLYEFLDAYIVRRFQMVGKDTFKLNYDNLSIKLNVPTLHISNITIIGKVISVIKEL
ncbi:MAG TPA: S24 family peptidase [Burkholderiales bacterium]|nr:S24 family peptidase [Burkholderiales bacterium]